jgi:small nuclear ribonucleoprotein (snRNP)-like protein
MNSPEFFQRVLGRQVLVRLANGIGLTGFLEAVDGSLNVVLRDQGKIVFIRGNHVFFLTPVQDESN